MKQIIAVVNQKGGVGKSTTAQALAAGLSMAGHAVLSIDMDQQGNLTFAMGAEDTGIGSGEMLLNKARADEVVLTLPQGDLIPASIGLSGADLAITGPGQEYRLRKAIAPLLDRYEYIVLDTPPSMGILSVNALTAATQVIVPVQADIFSLQGVGQLLATYEAVKEYTNPDISVRGLLLTRYSDRSVLSRQVRQMADEAAAQFGSVVFAASIREAVAIREAQISRQSIFEYAPRSNVAQDYEAFVREVLS